MQKTSFPSIRGGETITSANLSEFLKHAIGFDINTPINSGNYPPHNIQARTDDLFILTLAVAGFRREEISVALHKGVLTVSGVKEISDVGPYLYQGIGFRDFSRAFKLGGNVKVHAADLDHGLLKITLFRDIPEEERPTLIDIT